MPLIQISDDNPTGNAVSHFRNVKVLRKDRQQSPARGQHRRRRPRRRRRRRTGVPVYLHDWYGPGRHAKVEATNAKDFGADGLKYRAEPPLTGHESQVAEVRRRARFPKLLDPVDDLPPATVITQAYRTKGTR